MNPFVLLILGLISVFAQESQDVNTLTHEIEITDLADVIADEDAVKAEFHLVVQGQRKPWTVGSLPENLPKNRYDDLLAYDETRVVLEKLPDDPNSDYINANYMTGFHREKEYVATQGPLPGTIDDFWRMMWQLESRKIVMLANVIEHGQEKVAKYWPDKNQTYGEITVYKIAEHSVDDHKLRTFLVKKRNETETRVIKQFHYVGWPDFGVPQNRSSLLALIIQAKTYRPVDPAPLVIHCSAGVGRTGTTILVDTMLQSAHRTGKVDFLKKLEAMRNERIDVVEKEVQYLFAHKAVADMYHGNVSTEYFDFIRTMYDEFHEKDRIKIERQLSRKKRSFFSTGSFLKLKR